MLLLSFTYLYRYLNIYISLYNWAYNRARTHLCFVSPGQSRLATENESEVKSNDAGDVAMGVQFLLTFRFSHIGINIFHVFISWI